ncbi:MAG: hypothetical protein ACREQ5_05020 [Candidatus Dormibacteria bacterium]
MKMTKREVREALGFTRDKQLAAFFGLGKAAISAWRENEPIPEGRQWKARAIRPDVFPIPDSIDPSRRADRNAAAMPARRIETPIQRAYQQQQTAAAVRAFPCSTSRELARLCHMDRYVLARRLSECVTAGSVRSGPLRACGVTRQLALTWEPEPT